MTLAFNEDYVSKIRRIFGLNLYETKIWLALLSQGKSTTSKLSDIANIPKSRAYDILVSLENGGFIVRELGKPISYKAVPPDELLDKLQERYKEEFEYKVQKLGKLKTSSVLKDIQTLYSRGIKFVKEDKVATSYQGRDVAFFRIKRGINNAKEEVVVISTATGLVNKVKALSRALRAAKEKGVSVQVFAPIDTLSEEISDELKQIGKFTKINMDLGRFVIIDKNDVFIFTENDSDVHPSNEVVLNIKGNYLAERLKSLAVTHSAK